MTPKKARGLTFAQSLLDPAMGTDPEVFLCRDGKVIGSERVIPEEGLIIEEQLPDTTQPMKDGKFPYRLHRRAFPKVIRDGVQAEFVIAQSGYSCREEMRDAIKACFRLLDAARATIDWRTVVDVPVEELRDLSEKSRILGCAPSLNIYGPRDVGVPGDHPVRSAGGHLHLGFAPQWRDEVHANPAPLVALMDVVVGNTCVLLDRSPRAAERREVYGRAGEYRLPTHGLEYRTLSNFWLRAYVLHSFVWAATRFAVSAWSYDFGEELLNRVDIPKVAEAINTNDATKARETLEVVHCYMKEVLRDRAISQRFLPWDLAHFDHFVAKGIDHYWPTARGWATNWDGPGWESFRDETLAAEASRASAA
jgi:hypothetical protein